MRFANIQALRLFAAIGVLIFHAAVYVRNDRGGHFVLYFDRYLDYGVFLFFAISGFVILRPAIEQSIRTFLIARFLRIFPPFLLLAVVVSLGKLTMFGVGRFDPDLIKAMTLLPFGPIPYPVGIEWSLVYEVFFYIVIALLAAWVGQRRMPLFLIGWAVLIIAINVITPTVTTPLPTVSQIAMSGYALPFICGALAQIIYSRGARLSVPLALGIAVVLIGAAEFIDTMALRLLAQGIAFSAIVLAVASTNSQLRRDSWLVRGGDWSYGVYLMHVPVIQFLTRSHHFAHVAPDTLFAICAAVAVGVGLVYGAIEFAIHRRVSRHLQMSEASMNVTA